MNINVVTYRSRIGIFNVSRHISCRFDNHRKQTLSSRTRNISGFRIFRIVSLGLILAWCWEFDNEELQSSQEKFNGNIWSLSSASKPVSFFVLGGQVPPRFSPALHLSFCDILAVHSAATLGGVQGVHLDRGFIVTASHHQFSILSDSNFYAKYTYGNKSNRGIKLSHWNAGSAHLENKISEIENLICDFHPHLIGISEANLHRSHYLGNCRIADYELITSLTMDNEALQISRVVVYKHISLVAKVREDLMSDRFSSIWLEVGFPGRSKILVCNLYREWQYLGQVDHSSLDISEQLTRWILFLDQWEQALGTGMECIVMGDFNLDFMSFSRTDLPSNS